MPLNLIVFTDFALFVLLSKNCVQKHGRKDFGVYIHTYIHTSLFNNAG